MQNVPYIDDSVVVQAILLPFLEWNLSAWKGLPKILVETLNATLGAPQSEEDTELGWYPAKRLTYAVDAPCTGLAAYVRNNEVVLIEALVPPPLSAMAALGEPSAIKPHEILVENAYVHEYLFCERGLVLSVAEPLEGNLPLQIVRCRGIQPISSPEQFGPELYQSFEDRTLW